MQLRKQNISRDIREISIKSSKLAFVSDGGGDDVRQRCVVNWDHPDQFLIQIASDLCSDVVYAEKQQNLFTKYRVGLL